MYSLKNETDGIWAAPETFKTRGAALKYARQFRKRYAARGYYLTADGLRIAPADIELVISEEPAEPPG